jgi:hypothetical protein
MAKVSFSKLGLKKKDDIKIVKINDDIEIEVKQYLPINEKLVLISNVINDSADENNFANPLKIMLFASLQIIQYYTNLTFTDKQREDPGKLYDLLSSNGVIGKIIDAIPQEEYDFLIDGIYDSIDSVYDYRNSVLGILETISTDYSNLELDATELQKKMNDPNSLSLLKDVLTKLG